MTDLHTLFTELTDPWQDACMLVNLDGTIAAANRACAAMFPISGARSLIGQRLFELVLDSRERLTSYLKTCASGRQEIPGALTCPNARGEPERYRAFGYLVRDTVHRPCVLLRCRPARDAFSQFTILNRQMDEYARAHRDLQNSHNRLRMVLDSLDAIVYVADMETYELLFINEKGQKAFGNVTGKSCWQALQGESKGPCSFCTNTFLLHPDGSPAPVYNWEHRNPRTGNWYMLRDQAIEWTDGRMVRLEIATDITLRKAAELERHLSQNRIEALLSLSQRKWKSRDELVDFGLEQAVRLTDSGVGYLYLIDEDQRHRHLHTWPGQPEAAEFAPNPLKVPVGNSEVWTECVCQKQPIIHNEAAATPGTPNLPDLCTPISRHISVPLLEEGQVVAVLGVGKKTSPYSDEDAQQLTLFAQNMWHIIRQHSSERAIREAKERWELTYNAIEEIVTIHDEEMRLVLANKTAGDFFGTSPASLIGMKCHTLFRGSDEPCEGCPEVMAREDLQPHEGVVRHDNLNVIYQVSSAPLIDPDNTLRGFVHIAKDVTKQYLLQEQLRQTQKMEALGTLAGGIAHDFNNILSPILGYSDLSLLQTAPDSSLAGDLIQIKKAAERAKCLVQQILAFSRKAPTESQSIDPHLVIKEALKLLRASLPSTIEIQQNIAVTGCTVFADPTQIHQIVMNLCTNAYHAMQQSGGILRVSLQQVTVTEAEVDEQGMDIDPGVFARLTIRDTGCGMEPRVLDRIFDPYFTTKKKGEGTGLGLSVVHGIVKNYRGHVSVESERDKGTTVHVYLPRILATPTDADDGQVYLPGGDERILVVDDEETIATLMERMLGSLGYQVHTTTASPEALDLFHENPYGFDLIISDMTMPHLTGTELSQLVLMERPDMPIILCTGFSKLITREMALAMGIREFFTKPVTLHELAMAIRRILT